MSPHLRRARDRALASATVATLVAGCGQDASSADRLTVFAAASLKQSFTQIGQQFEAAHPESSVEFSFAGSSDLVAQLTQGASADVFASADTENMARAAEADLLAGAPVDFASNVLTIAVAPGNPQGIATFGDLARTGLNVVTCAPQVPCGAATETIEEVTGVQLAPVSEESSVTDVLGKVSSGQADAGLVYVTDVAGAGGKVAAVDFPEAADAVNTYPIATLKDSADAELAGTFVDFVVGEMGQKVLGDAGFGAP